MPQRALIDMTLAEIMSIWPATLPVFVRHRMLCIGCPISPFHTLADAAAEHGLDLGLLSAEVAAARGGSPSGRIREGPA